MHRNDRHQASTWGCHAQPAAFNPMINTTGGPDPDSVQASSTVEPTPAVTAPLTVRSPVLVPFDDPPGGVTEQSLDGLGRQVLGVTQAGVEGAAAVRLAVPGDWT